MPPVSEITQWLVRWRDGDEKALDGLTRLVYADLRRVAAGLLRAERDGHTMQPTALVHELYTQLSVSKPPGIEWQCRGQFFAIAARLMRQILVDCARKRSAQKRRNMYLAPFAGNGLKAGGSDLLEVDMALSRLAKEHPRQALVVELRFFGGLTAEETAEAIRASGEEISLRTVERDWRFSRAWLQNELA
ncbi:MAG: ECF-type sigma factor [Bryobacteraceae bacterium]